jgi:hypothetical protein
MTRQDFTVTISVEKTPEEVFGAICNVRGWWSQAIEGVTDEAGAVFYYHYKDDHRCTIKITDLVPGKRVAWRVLHNTFSFIKDQTEWNGTEIIFEISKKGDHTEARFTHVGLVRAYECYDVCTNAWGGYITGSLRDLIVTGKGEPNPMEEHADHQEEVVAKVREKSRKLQKERA